MSSTSEVREIAFGRPWITDDERAAVLGVLSGPILTHGPQGKAFEAEFAAFAGPAARAVAVSSCMAALHLAYLAVGVEPGDEVLVPAQTHTATVHAVEWVGATPVFVDCSPADGNVTAAAIERAITPRTRAVAVVHFAGIPCDMPSICDLAASRGLKVVEDCALALGARYRGTHVGLFGDAGCFSFYPVKHITTGEGGMLLTRHPELADRVGRLRAFGVDRTFTERTIPGMYDVPTLGLNYRMSEMQAALGRVQLARVGEILERRRRNFDALARGVRAIRHLAIVEPQDQAAASSHYCLTVRIAAAQAAQRNALVLRLNAAGVGTSVHYPQPVPRMTYYRKKYGYDQSRFPGAAGISDDTFALPVAPHVTRDDITYMIAALSQAVSEVLG
jgi:dTDP-4-amino-4,6-dideoxygalactose transaminase